MTDLESLDLSSNQLSGEIPQELTDLTFLSVLNLSSNHLVGKIPQENQFSTFNSSSYEGNVGLCGPLLSKLACGASPYTPGAAKVYKSPHRVDVVLFVFIGLGFGIGFAMAIVLKWG
jgi:Leucine-rich repeat (LRR) protein